MSDKALPLRQMSKVTMVVPYLTLDEIRKLIETAESGSKYHKVINQNDLFNNIFSVTTEDIEFEFRYPYFISWLNFFLNPRLLRGSDFLMRWSQGVWSEKLVLEAINETSLYFAIPYGLSGVAPNDPKEAQAYFDRLEKAGLGKQKRPDLLVFWKSDEEIIEEAICELGGKQNLPFTNEEDEPLKRVLLNAILAIECENSLWKAQQMPNYDDPLRPMRRLGGQLGLPKTAKVPTIILKDEDRSPLRQWQEQKKIDIHIWHIFYDLAFGISLNKAETLISKGSIEARSQTFQAPAGTTTTKFTYNIYYQHGYPVGKTQKEPKLIADYVIDKNGHILPYVRFEGGRLEISSEALDVLLHKFFYKSA